MGVGEGRITRGVALGCGVTVGLGVDRATGVAVGRGVGNTIGVEVGICASSSRTPSTMRRFISCSEGPQAGLASISAASIRKLSRHENALRVQQCFLSFKGELSSLASVAEDFCLRLASANQTGGSW